MSHAAGYTCRAAWRGEGVTSDYGAASAVSQQIPLLFETMSQELETLPDNDALSGGAISGHAVTAIRASGQLHCAMTYQGLESLLASALGLCHYHDSPALLATGVYRHTILPDHNLHDQTWAAGDYLPGAAPAGGEKKIRRGTLCLDKGVSVWEFRSAMVNALALKGDGIGVRLEAELIACGLGLNTSTNPNAAAWAIPPGDFPRVLFNDLTLTIAPWSGSQALDSQVNGVGVRSFALALDNQLVTHQDSLSGLTIAQPQRDSGRKRQLTLDLTLPRYSDDSWLQAVAGQTPFMARLAFVGRSLASGYTYALDIWLPCLRLVGGRAAIGGPGLLAPDYTFVAELPPAPAAGFPAEAASNEIVIQVVSGLATNPLRNP